ncbi:MAG: hypothetical protein EXR43_03745 [Dehalococcoidia bacterium]|nr:hypothetical protein [Dehalococcoidia bacterium]
MSQRRRPGRVPETRRGFARLRQLDPAAWPWIGAGVLFLVVLGLIGAGLYSRYYAPPRETVLTVGEREYTMSYFVKRIRYYLADSATAGLSISAADAPNAVLATMEQAALLLASAESEGLTATDDEVKDRLYENVARLSGADLELPDAMETPTATPAADATATAGAASSPVPAETEAAASTPSPSPFAFSSDKDYRDALKKVRDLTGFSEDELREIARAEVLRERLRDTLKTLLSATALQSQLDVIYVQDRAAAEGAKTRLDGGEPFVQVQADVSPQTLPLPIGAPAADTPTAEVERQETPWVIKEMLLAQFQEPVFSTPVGGYTGIIATDRGAVIVGVRRREERALDNTHREFLLADAVDNWFETQRGAIAVQRSLDSEKTAWALDRVR